MKDEAPIVTLTPTELWKIDRLAAWRNDPKLGTVTNRNRCGGDDFKLNRLGVIGEYAVSVYFREPMDLFIDLGGDDNVTDLVIANMTTAVKCSPYSSPHLIFDTLEEFHQNVAVLASFHEPKTVRLHGWTTPERFAECAKLSDFGHGPCFAVDARDLYHVTLLKAISFDRWRRGQLGGKLMQLEGA
jgi:hypothetical protein